jgi:UDP-sugar transporter A1/2/3
VAIPVEANNYSYPRYPIYVKAIVLASLALHHAGGILFMSYVRKQTDSRFINSVVVFICEIQKTILSLILIFGEERSLIGGLKTIYNKIILQPKDTLKMLIPAVIYTIQNNLNLQAITVLDPAILVVHYFQCA